jgi:hypothetical protein
MEVLRYSETPTNLHGSKWRHIEEGDNLHSYRCEILKSKLLLLYSS